MRIRWTPAAASDLESIKSYLSQHFPHLAQSTVKELYANIHSLGNTPYRGRRGREDGTRELISGRLPYVTVYRVKGSAVEILHIWHAAQNR